MTLPSTLSHKTEWVLLGPMGPGLPQFLIDLPLLGVDGGAHFTEKMDVWVGDADSFQGDIHSSHIFRHPTGKDKSDLALALRFFDGPRHYKLHLWGLLGGRKDHELFNLGEALGFLGEHPECQVLFYNKHGKITFHAVGAGHWKFTHVGIFSLGTLKKTDVKLTGACQYPIPSAASLEPLSSFGLSNQGHGEMQLETEGPVFLCYPEEE